MILSNQRKTLAPVSLQVMIVIAIAIAAGRIACVTSPEGDTAFLSANDRSRWCTIASLVEDGTYAIDRQVAIANPIHRNRRPWGTIDKVRHTGADGKLHYYSSKPPLFPTMIAGVYKVMHLSTGMTMTAQPIYVPRMILAIVNLPILALFLVCTTFVIGRVCQTTEGKALAVAFTCFGTMMLPFTVSLNNHLPAAAAMAVAAAFYVYVADRIAGIERGDSLTVNPGAWLVIGLAAGFAAANELPALSMTAFWFVLCAWLDRRSIVPFVGGLTLVAIAFFGTNWIAHQSFRPPYAHRGVGETIAVLDPTAKQADLPQANSALAGQVKSALLANRLIEDDAVFTIYPSDEAKRYVVRANDDLFALIPTGEGWRLAKWDDWYEYPGSYWQDGNRRGVDLGEPSRVKYFLNMTVGHYGLFSLTPIWLLLPIGFFISLRMGPDDYRRMSAAILLATLVCAAFYISRPMIDRNYGGVSTCFRWMLWFSPLWLMMIAPVLDDWSESPWLRRVAIGLLALSAISMSTALSSPWQSPWLYRFWQFLGWIDA
ncbi:hypothetical protein [Rubripirellula reticaptiva]|uniref:Glycosyltransferase RgtA/B/C/D-like domain-containing protein n=1 Tax=Rubripirellula reticaptiva TaxID=2528013 RepID=A0A5C6EHM4_9BACT|nr:hypothetical protein [Rubripirellula reticaptiva]TWU48328.1 hypothetical protein Poly59_51740 [Rubripirellula reticaptiva]